MSTRSSDGNDSTEHEHGHDLAQGASNANDDEDDDDEDEEADEPTGLEFTRTLQQLDEYDADSEASWDDSLPSPPVQMQRLLSIISIEHAFDDDRWDDNMKRHVWEMLGSEPWTKLRRCRALNSDGQPCESGDMCGLCRLCQTCGRCGFCSQCRFEDVHRTLDTFMKMMHRDGGILTHIPAGLHALDTVVMRAAATTVILMRLACHAGPLEQVVLAESKVLQRAMGMPSGLLVKHMESAAALVQRVASLDECTSASMRSKAGELRAQLLDGYVA